MNRELYNLKQKNKAQVTLELTVALICLVIFLTGTLKLFGWFCSSLIGREKAYNATRATMQGNINRYYHNFNINFYTPEKLDIFNEHPKEPGNLEEDNRLIGI